MAIYPYKDRYRVPHYVEGKRKFKYFKTREEAEDFDTDLKLEKENSALAITPEERILIARLRKVAKLNNVDLFEASEKLVDIIKDLAAPKIPLQTALVQYIDDCEKRNLRKDSLEQYETYCQEFISKTRCKYITEVTYDEVVRHILNRFSNDNSRGFVKTALSTWLKWCQRKGWCSGFEKEFTWDRAKTDEKHIEIFTPEIFEKIINDVPASIRTGLALMAFAGIRPEEVVSAKKPRVLRWDDINFDAREIRIVGATAKTRTARTIHHTPDNLWAWLEDVPSKSRKGQIVTCSYRTFRVNRTRALERLGIEKWPQDVLRHSFGSYGFHFLGVNETIEIMRHTNPKMFFTHYKSDANKLAADKWFNIYPPKPKEA